MHFHGTKLSNKKLSRKSGPRRALLRGLLDSLILYERIETTEAKARALAPYFEAQVTRAKKQTLPAYRQILAETINPVAGQKLYYDLVNGFATRQGGYTRIIKTGQRLGDGASMAVVELVLDENYSSASQDNKVADTAKKPEAEVKKSDTKAVVTKSAIKKPTKKATKSTEKVTTKITSGRKGSK